jgi:hypothetical protein
MQPQRLDLHSLIRENKKFSRRMPDGALVPAPSLVWRGVLNVTVKGIKST